ncbi:MAG: GNAT family N-acetyltransferase [Taibaiella sp.]|nr:GNAT family N-acetyltransferase [Taibaiella sp.]
MHPFSPLSTKRLHLRELTDHDLHTIYALRTNDEVRRYIGRPPLKDVSEAQAFIDRIKAGYAGKNTCYWVITLKDTGELIGTICLWNISADETTAEIGYEMLPQHHGNGYMHEAMSAVLAFSFGTLHLQAIEAFTHSSNARSRHLLQKHGFTLCEGRKDPDVPTNVVYRKEMLAAS